MAGNTGGGGEAHELAGALRKLREASGLTVRAVADRIDVPFGNVTHWEKGTRLPTEERLAKLLEVYLDPDSDERERLQGLLRQASGPGHLVAGAPSIGAQLNELIKYERVASRIVDVAPLVIPGLLQTEDYAAATFAGMSDIDSRVTLRVGRSRIILRDRDPVDFLALIDSEVLVRPIAPPEVMLGQLKHLLAMAERPNVTVQLVSSTTPGYHPMLAGPFILLEFPSAAPVVHLEHRRASAFLWEEGDVKGFSTSVEEIQEVAMTPTRSVEAIAQIVRGMETT